MNFVGFGRSVGFKLIDVEGNCRAIARQALATHGMAGGTDR
jgi:hypothetical protein